MTSIKSLLATLIMFFSISAVAADVKSIYTQRPDDPEAFYFTPENYNIKADGKMDVSEALQEAVNQVKRERNFGILFIPEGKYRLSKTIYIPAAVRIIGYGKNRPEFILSANSPGYQNPVLSDKGKAKYLFWFTGGLVTDESRIGDANAGTFYSCMSNVNIRIEDGNPEAVALRTHYAQHSFISHVAIYAGTAKAGMFDCGNEMSNVAFYGGDYGIYTTKASPGWPVVAVDMYFEGQRKAAMYCQESGLAMVNLQVKNVPSVFELMDNYADRLVVDGGRFENVSGPALIVSNEDNSNTQINFMDIWCKGVGVLAKFKKSGKEVILGKKSFYVSDFLHGFVMDDMTADARFETRLDAEPVKNIQDAPVSVLPSIPDMSQWVNLRDLGAKGDGETDDTEAIMKAIEQYDNIYVPSGWYVVSNTIKLRPGTKLIGLHPFSTQFKIKESTTAFSGFGTPVPLVESSEGGDDVLSGIGINTGAYNYRACGVKWMAGKDSYLNDVKFVGGHGTMSKPVPGRQRGGSGWSYAQRISSPESPVTASGMDYAWDKQYYSLWVTNGGGGTFKDIWTASTYALNGFYVEDTDTPGNVYAMSIEHHVINEVRMSKVSNWKFYCMQTEEESRESMECQPIELDDCSNLAFYNTYMFRVIRVNEPYHSSIRIRNCSDVTFANLHNYSQVKYTTDIPVFDHSKNIEVRPWELARLTITGNEPSRRKTEGNVTEIASDFDFAEGIASDSKGNVYFCDNRMHRIYRIDAKTQDLSLVADFHWKPISVAFDTQDNMLVLFRYDPQPGFNADPHRLDELPDSHGTSFSGWGNSGFSSLVYTMDPDDPAETLTLLPLVDRSKVKTVKKAFYASNRWRDYHDFNEAVVFRPEKCFLAPDGVTVIPQQYDLARTSSLLPAYPGKKFYCSDEYDKRIVSCDVLEDGTLTGLEYHVEYGEFGLTEGKDGSLYVADGDVLVFDADGAVVEKIAVPERPSTIVFGGEDGKSLYATGRKRVFRVDGK